MTNPGLPPPLSSARREQEATRVIDLRQEIEDALAELDAALGAIGQVGGQGPAGGRADTEEAQEGGRRDAVRRHPSKAVV